MFNSRQTLEEKNKLKSPVAEMTEETSKLKVAK